MDFIWFIFVGLIAGWLGESLMGSHGAGLVVSIIHGVLGAVIGGSIFRYFGLSSGGGFAGSILVATTGAVLLIFVLRAIRKV